jgi:hypothetical protein
VDLPPLPPPPPLLLLLLIFGTPGESCNLAPQRIRISQRATARHWLLGVMTHQLPYKCLNAVQMRWFLS